MTTYRPDPADDLVFQPPRPFADANSQQQFASKLQATRRLRQKLYLRRKERGEDVSCEFPCACRDDACGCSEKVRDAFASNHEMKGLNRSGLTVMA